jgi:hypothetical protein
MPNQKDILLLSLGDFFSPKVMLITFLSTILTLGIMGCIVILGFENLENLWDIILHFFHEIKFDFIEKIQEIPILGFLMEHELSMTLLRYLIGFGLGVVLYYVFFIVYALIIGLFANVFIRYVHSKYYNYMSLEGMNVFHMIVFYLKTVVMTFIIFVICIPCYFIPVFNFMIFLPLYYFFHKTLVFDVSSEINTRREYKKIKQVNWGELKVKTGGCFIFSLIPVLGVIVYPVYILFISHYLFRETKELRFINGHL